MLSRDLTLELKVILGEEFSLKLSDSEVSEIGSMFVNYLELLIKMNNQ
jgi:hypothetical protein